MADVKTTAASGYVGFNVRGYKTSTNTKQDVWERLSYVFVAPASEIGYCGIGDWRTSNWDNVFVKNFITVDLTLFFNGNIPTNFSAADFEALYPNAYYEYNTGQLINNSAKALETVGRNIWDEDTSFNGQYEPYKRNVLDLHLENIQVKSPNIWDEEWESGGWDTSNGTKFDIANYSRSKNKFECEPSTIYFANIASSAQIWILFWNANGDYCGQAVRIQLSSSGEFTTPSDAHYMAFHTNIASIPSSTYCINKSDAGFNGKYFPHGELTIEGGLKSAGDVYDEITNNGRTLIRRLGDVVLGDCTSWIYDSTNKRFVATEIASIVKKPASESSVPNILSNIYEAYANNANNGNSVNMKVSLGGGGGIVCTNTAYTTPAAFKTAMAGVPLYYELANYETYELVDALPSVYPIDVLGTESIVSDGLVAPFKADIEYGAKQKDFAWHIDNLWSKIADMDIKHYQSGTAPQGSPNDVHVIKIGGKTLYIKFNVTEADASTTPQTMPSFTLAMADNPNGENEQEVTIGTISEPWIIDH